MTGTLTKKAARDELVRQGYRPRLLSLSTAAAYVNLSQAGFLRAVKDGLYPQPIVCGCRKQWDVRALDIAIDRLSGVAPSLSTESSDDIMKAIENAKF